MATHPTSIGLEWNYVRPSGGLLLKESASAIERLLAKDDLHLDAKNRLLDRLNYFERSMSNLYERWTYNERATQAYVRLPDYEKKLKAHNESGSAPQIVSIIVPYVYSSIESMVTYLTSVLFGPNPVFPTQAGPGVNVDNARRMEQVLQYNVAHSKMVRSGFQFVWDSAVYGLGAMQIPYVTQFGTRTKVTNLFGKDERTKEERLIYSGNMPDVIDPWKFFPDPRGPMNLVSSKGDFCFWRSFTSRLDAKTLEDSGVSKGLDRVSLHRRRRKLMEAERLIEQKRLVIALQPDRAAE